MLLPMTTANAAVMQDIIDNDYSGTNGYSKIDSGYWSYHTDGGYSGDYRLNAQQEEIGDIYNWVLTSPQNIGTTSQEVYAWLTNASFSAVTRYEKGDGINKRVWFDIDQNIAPIGWNYIGGGPYGAISIYHVYAWKVSYTYTATGADAVKINWRYPGGGKEE
ncbi:hypothetical protein RV11_GL003142 [Enterococcus phoeniculicola]|nr:hypothetical protein RV11_GL003142 [Enterococcus phoeniculicola]